MDLYKLDKEIRVKGRANVLTLLWSARGYFWRPASARGESKTPAGQDLIEHVSRFKQHMGNARIGQATVEEELHTRLSKAWIPLKIDADGRIVPGSIQRVDNIESHLSEEDVQRLLRIKAELRASGQRRMQAERESRRIKVLILK